MRIIDFHNHFYPPAYLDALRSGSSAVQVTIDEDGNPRIYYPGDYNVAVPGHRDIDYREQVLIEHGVDTQVITLTTPGTHVEAPATAVRFASLVNDAFADIRENKRGRLAPLATMPLNDPTASVKELRVDRPELRFVQSRPVQRYLAERLDRGFEAFSECRANISRPPSTYLKQFYFDTANFDLNPIELASIRALKRPGEDKAAVFDGNAARLLGIA